MPKVGDTIQVQIKGGETGTSLGGGGASVAIGSGASISVSGVIIEDLGDRWLVRLNMSIGGKNQIAVPK